jgi:hypothetical protein
MEIRSNISFSEQINILVNAISVFKDLDQVETENLLNKMNEEFFGWKLKKQRVDNGK